MENGSHKKFDGVVWRTICSIDGCFIAAQRNELCRKHFIQLNGNSSPAPTMAKNSNYSGKRINSLSSSEEKQIDIKDESTDYDENYPHSLVSTSREKFPTSAPFFQKSS